MNKLPPLPAAWPSDKRTRVNVIEGVTILRHPDRPAHQLNNQSQKWEEIQRIA